MLKSTGPQPKLVYLPWDGAMRRGILVGWMDAEERQAVIAYTALDPGLPSPMDLAEMQRQLLTADPGVRAPSTPLSVLGRAFCRQCEAAAPFSHNSLSGATGMTLALAQCTDCSANSAAIRSPLTGLLPAQWPEAQFGTQPARLIFFTRPTAKQYYSATPLELSAHATSSSELAARASPVDDALCWMNLSAGLSPVDGALILPSSVQLEPRAVAEQRPSLSWRAFLAFLFLVEWICKPIQAVLQQPIGIPRIYAAPLCSISSTGFQLNVRIQQLRSFRAAMQSLPLAWHKSHATSSHFIRQFNTLWLFLNDVIFGVHFGWALIANMPAVLVVLDHWMQNFLHDSMIARVHWLMGEPAGIKMNEPLATTLGSAMLQLIEVWSVWLHLLRPYLPLVLYAIAFSGLIGGSMVLSLVLDLIGLLSLHLKISYVVLARIYRWQLTVLASLWRLFRGLKSNALRNRIDSNEFSVEQLLLGTGGFTILLLLFPTPAMFYLYTLLVRNGACGVYFEIADAKFAQSPLELKHKPLAFSSVFVEYGHTIADVLARYRPSFVLRSLLRGDAILSLQTRANHYA
ncbi:hypothetical protein CAOG_008046 [Capsaspora owczarzaki ATCC 30864]|uniref:Uncharacterized protein n=1 Tax=Capsaspora owczarzaki (strain ATCC 30864) TaxID=595528 RepID=A0A0D2W149_CAPO3|nr:hypothetical protein CAOG_008046 [Capsaspora owczarzaki ATCC 30864]